MGRVELFDGNDSENDDISKIEIDEDYARRFEHNKRREGLQRLEELKKKGVVSSSSSSSEGEEESESESSDDSDENLIISSKRDKEFFDALIKVRKQDPILKQKDVKLFESDHSSDEESNEKTKDKKGKNPIHLKEVMPKYLMEDGPDFVDREREHDEKGKGNLEDNKGKYGKIYDEEQKMLVKNVLEAAGREDAEDGEGDFFTVKEKAAEDVGKSDNKEFEKKLVEYFGGDVELNEDSKFLKSYFMNKMWLDKNKENSNILEDELQIISEDESEIERQEEYEFRYQENQGDRVLGHARKVEGSVRKKTNARKEQRKSKEERLAIVQKEREEELKHLKNLKKQEMQEKVKRIMMSAGIGENDIITMTTREIEEEFDPEEYDRMMKAAFDEKYYNAEDADPDFGSDDNDEMEKPDFEKEDELLGLPQGWDEYDFDDGFSAARERALKQKMENLSNSDDQEGEQEDDQEKIPEEGKRKRKRKTALLEKARQAMLDEYYKLDYEDTIGDLKTRFKYTKTKPNRYGLTPEELLTVDDKELNEYISLKKLAPYREEEWKLGNLKRYQLKKKIKEILHAGGSHKKKKDKKPKNDAGNSTLSNGEVDNEKADVEKSNVDTDKLSRKAKRRQRQADLKLSHSRLLAYNKTQSKSKGRRKH